MLVSGQSVSAQTKASSGPSSAPQSAWFLEHQSAGKNHGRCLQKWWFLRLRYLRVSVLNFLSFSCGAQNEIAWDVDRKLYESTCCDLGGGVCNKH
eukprot:SAG11_NODE_5673_length_1490_cov_1.160316_2_plen_94_part_01